MVDRIDIHLLAINISTDILRDLVVWKLSPHAQG